MKKLFILFLLSPAPIAAQQPSTQPPPVTQSITVTTTIEPLPLAESNRSVNLIEPRDEPLISNSVVDYLRQDTSLNLQARAPNGVQADLSLRGTTFEQSLILLNGLRINDPETGHLNLDIPIPLDAVTRIDILHGSGSTFYGSDTIGGAVNLLTKPAATGPAIPSLSVIASIGAGSYASLEQHLRASYTRGPTSEQLTASRDTSDGFIPDRNYSSNALASETWLTTKPGTTDILLATSDRPYGANLFYGPYPSWERTKGWFASIQQQLSQQTAASFGYRRHSDFFVLFVDQPAIYENNHVTTSYEGALRRADNFGANNTTLSYGVEADGDTINSNSLGQHSRNQGAAYANLSLRALGRFSLSIGVRDEILTGAIDGTDNVFSPSIAAAFTLTHTARLRASAGHGFRFPTYVDLYYADPTTIGNPNLKPESSWSYEAGIEWTPANSRLTLNAAGFYLQQTDTIDYAKTILATQALTASQPWQAINIQNLNITGAEAALRLRLTHNQQLQFSYTAAHATSPPPNLLSEYAYNYATQNALVRWTSTFHQLNVHTQINVVQKTQHTAYPLWDIAVSRNTGHIRPYLRGLNLSNTNYEEIPQVPLQGRTVMAGVEFNWSHKKK
ncbi:MAG TPA: TonB-dependent receptor [Edaphobacter sp.]|jgi:outer membrane cobalamin receptor|nr:TonB-dependent receptor [Edaphobacter sp.]